MNKYKISLDEILEHRPYFKISPREWRAVFGGLKYVNWATIFCTARLCHDYKMWILIRLLAKEEKVTFAINCSRYAIEYFISHRGRQPEVKIAEKILEMINRYREGGIKSEQLKEFLRPVDENTYRYINDTMKYNLIESAIYAARSALYIDIDWMQPDVDVRQAADCGCFKSSQKYPSIAAKQMEDIYNALKVMEPGQTWYL